MSDGFWLTVGIGIVCEVVNFERPFARDDGAMARGANAFSLEPTFDLGDVNQDSRSLGKWNFEFSSQPL